MLSTLKVRISFSYNRYEQMANRQMTSHLLFRVINMNHTNSKIRLLIIPASAVAINARFAAIHTHWTRNFDGIINVSGCIVYILGYLACSVTFWTINFASTKTMGAGLHCFRIKILRCIIHGFIRCFVLLRLCHL